MPDDLYDRDALAWSEHQAALLRRLSVGDQPNEDPDWPHVIEEIEAMGRAELRAAESLLRRAIEHLLKIRAWPDGPVEHWRGEVNTFLRDASEAYSMSMISRIDIASLYRRALSDVGRLTIDGRRAGALPQRCPFALADLVSEGDELPDLDTLAAKLDALER